MRTALTYVIALSIALWLGGLATLFMTLIAVFKHDHALGRQVGPVLFGIFEPYQIALGVIAIACTIAWRMYACSRAKKAMLACLLGAALIAVSSYALLTPSIIDFSRNPNTTVTPEKFQQYHRTSERLYMGIAVLVLLAGGFCVAAIRADASGGFAKGFAAASNKPDPADRPTAETA